jgi:hypothetical protein
MLPQGRRYISRYDLSRIHGFGTEYRISITVSQLPVPIRMQCQQQRTVNTMEQA